MSTTITIRIDERVKNDATEVLSNLGLDMSSAIGIFLRQVALKKAIPFSLDLSSPNEVTKEAIKAALEQKGLIGPFSSSEELMEYLDED